MIKIELILIGIGLFILFNVLFWVNWINNKSMTLDYCSEWGYADFDTFLKHFNAVQWDSYDGRWPESFFDYGRGSQKSNYIHAGIIKFNDNGMVIKPLSYLKYLWFIRKKKNERLAGLQIKGLWD